MLVLVDLTEISEAGAGVGWSTWGLRRLPDDASSRHIIDDATGLVVVDVNPLQVNEYERLSERWAVSTLQIAPPSPMLRNGCIAIWRAFDRDNPEDTWIWGGPTRVLSVVQTNNLDRIEVCSLEDGRLNDLELAEEDADRALNLLDEVGTPGAGWALLSLWGLRPLCPNCRGESIPISYGLPAPGGALEHLHLGGCVVGADDPDWHCPVCNQSFTADGPGDQVGPRQPPNAVEPMTTVEDITE